MASMASGRKSTGVAVARGVLSSQFSAKAWVSIMSTTITLKTPDILRIEMPSGGWVLIQALSTVDMVSVHNQDESKTTVESRHKYIAAEENP